MNTKCFQSVCTLAFLLLLCLMLVQSCSKSGGGTSPGSGTTALAWDSGSWDEKNWQ